MTATERDGPSRDRAPQDVVLLLTDQERFDVTHPDGPPVKTPNVDRLRDQGVAFDRAYTPISICSSARASLLTGLYPHNHGMLNNCHAADAVATDLPADIPTFGELLTDAGYDNSYLGKWHVGRTQTPADFGFEFLGGGDGHHEADDPDFRSHQRALGVDPDDVELEETLYTDNPDPELVAAKTPIPVEATHPYYLAERTIERLESLDETDAGASARPFFHRTDFPGPHHPYVVPEPYASMYDPDDVDLWPTMAETYDGKPAVQERYLSYRGVADFSDDDWREAIAKYFGFVTLIDDQIGRILDAIDRIDRDPVVVHAADHGDFIGSHRQFNKGPLMYEETYRIPLVVRWPDGGQSGAIREAFVRLHDLMPTFLDLANVDPPADVDGRSLVPLLRGEAPADWPDAVCCEYHGDEFGLYSQRMIRTERFKYVYNPPGVDELYDLAADPEELTNLVENPRYADVRDRLQRRLHEWMDETDDTIARWSEKVLVDE